MCVRLWIYGAPFCIFINSVSLSARQVVSKSIASIWCMYMCHSNLHIYILVCKWVCYFFHLLFAHRRRARHAKRQCQRQLLAHWTKTLTLISHVHMCVCMYVCVLPNNFLICYFCSDSPFATKSNTSKQCVQRNCNEQPRHISMYNYALPLHPTPFPSPTSAHTHSPCSHKNVNEPIFQHFRISFAWRKPRCFYESADWLQRCRVAVCWHVAPSWQQQLQLFSEQWNCRIKMLFFFSFFHHTPTCVKLLWELQVYK